MTSQQRVFLSIRNGTLGLHIDQFTTEDLNSFLPTLIYQFFTNTEAGSETNSQNEHQLNAIRSRLINCPAGNDVYLLCNLNYDSLESKFNGVHSVQPSDSNYSLLSLQEKVILIGSHLLNRVKNYTALTESFEAFDVENYQEEIICIISILCMNLPGIFNVAELTPILLNYTHGPQILIGTLLNHPSLLEHVLDKVLEMDNAEMSKTFMKRRQDTILAILRLDSTQTERLLKTSFELESRLRLCVDVLCSNDLVDDQFFITTLFSHLMNEKGEFYQFLTKSANKDYMIRIRTRFNAILDTQMQSTFKEQVILLLAVLSNLGFLRANTDATHQWVKFLTSQTVDNLRVVKMVLAVILACPNLLPPNQQAFRDEYVEQQLTEFFQWIKEKTEMGDPNEYGPLNRFMLLSAIHMQNSHGEELSKLLSDELSFNVGDMLRKQITIKMLYLRHAMPENAVAQKAVQLDVTKHLDANFTGYLPAHCVNHLLKDRTFSKYQLTIQDWIKRQIQECQLPIHSCMIDVLDNFAASCFPTRDDSNYNTQIEEQYFWDIFSTGMFCDDKTLASKALALFYLLAYTCHLEMKPQVMSVGGKKVPSAYSDKLWAEIPIRYLLILVIDARPTDFELMRADLLHKIGTLMPHMLPMLDASIDRTEDELAAKTFANFKSIPKEMFSKALDNIETRLQMFTILVDHLQAAPIQEQHIHHATIIKSMLVSLDEKICPLPVTLQLAQIWHRLSDLIPRKLFEQTLQLWLNTPRAATHGTIEVDNSVLLNETPTLMFRVDDRVFRSPPHFELLMKILAFYLEASKNYNNVRYLKATTTPEKKMEINEIKVLINSYMGAQTLTAIQLLLEVCNGNKEKEPNLEEIRNIACSQIHQMFVVDIALPKLVHFNMYPIDLIPMLVEKVPSMHVLIVAIAELMAHDHLKRRIFAVNLAAELATKYTVASALSAIEYVEDVLLTIMEATVDEQTIVLFLNITDALRKFQQFGSPHTEFVKNILNRVRDIARARCAMYRSESAMFLSPERQLISKIDKIIS